MDSELQWFSDSEIWPLFERGATSYLYVSVLLLIWFSYSETWSPFERRYRFDAFLYDAMKYSWDSGKFVQWKDKRYY